MYVIKSNRQTNSYTVRKINRITQVVRVGRRGLKGDPGDELVESVNGKQGVVVLNASDVGADTAGSSAAALASAKTYTDTKTAGIATEAQVQDVQDNLDAHEADTANPHSVTKAQIGLGNVDNTSDANKPLSTAQQDALDGKSDFLFPSHSAAFPRQKPYSVDTMSSGWSDEYTTGTVGFDSSVSMNGTSSIKVTTGTTSTPSGMSKSGAFDYSSSSFKLWVRSTDWSIVQVARILFFTSPGNYFSLNLNLTYIDMINTSGQSFDEWYDLYISRGKFHTAGSPSWSNITKVVVDVVPLSGSSATVWFGGLSLFNDAKKGAISISFDDGWQDTYTEGAKYMASKGIAGTAYVIPELIGASGYMTQEQVEMTAGLGWDISGHGKTDLTTLSDLELDNDLKNTAKYLNNMGYNGNSAYAYPNGMNNDKVRAAVSKYFSSGRTINYSNQSLVDSNNMRINALSPTNSWTFSMIKEYIDSAVANKEWLILTFHKVVETATISTEMSRATFRQVVDYIASLDIDVAPVSSILSRSWTDGGANGDVIGIGTSSANSLPRYSDATGKSIKTSPVKVDDNGNITGAGQVSITNTFALNGQANAFSILNRAGTNRFGAFQFQTAGTTVGTIGIYNNATNDLVINSDASAAGRRRAIVVKTNGDISLNDEAGDRDTVAKGTSDQNLLRVDASENKVGIGVDTPTSKLDILGDSIRLRSSKTPPSATAAGNAGEICWDENYVYVCTATNTWKRSPLSSW